VSEQCHQLHDILDVTSVLTDDSCNSGQNKVLRIDILWFCAIITAMTFFTWTGCSK